MESTRPPIPTFLIIGAQKSATRWLRYNLGLHPDIYTVDYEVTFFNRRRSYAQGIDWYRDQFVGWSGEPVVGEATPGYMMFTKHPGRVAHRIHEAMPDVRLVAILRNPVDRANSAMVHHMRRGRIPRNARLLDLVESQPPEEDRFGLVTGGWYARSLKQYQRLFGDQLLVLLHDEVVADPRAVYERTLRHVGASPGFAPPGLEQIVFSNQQARSRWLREVTFVDRLKLFQYFRPDVHRTARMFDLDLEEWDPARHFRGKVPRGWAFGLDLAEVDGRPRQPPVA